MTIRQRHLATHISTSGARPSARWAIMVLPLALAASTASAGITTHPKDLHRTPAATRPAVSEHSAGRDASHALSTAKPRAAVPAEKSANRSVVAKASTRKGSPIANGEDRNTVRKGHIAGTAPETVTMHRAPANGAHRDTRPPAPAPPAQPNLKAERTAVAATPRARTAGPASLPPTPPTVDKTNLAMDDSTRAAVTPADEPEPAPATGEVFGIVASGESHPDPDERITVSEDSAPVAPLLVVTQAPAPIVRVPPSRTAVAVADVAPKPMRTTVAHPVTSTKYENATAFEAEPLAPVVLSAYTRSGKLIVPAPLKGSHEVLVHQNQMADDAGLSRIQDDEDLDRMRAAHLLVSFPDTPALEVNEELPLNRRYARPWTVKFATDTAKAFYARFHEPLRLNSAVRTVDYQVKLRRTNGNAAAIDGDGASPHLTGQAIDFGKRGMSMAELAWMRAYLLPLMQSGKVDVEEEFQQSCFHISVYAGYLPKKHAEPRNEVAQLGDKQQVDTK